LFSTAVLPSNYHKQAVDEFGNRMSAAVNDANDARAFFGGNWDHPLANGAFRYTRSGKTYLSSKDDAITKKWRTLLTPRPDVAEHWTYFKAKLPLQTTNWPQTRCILVCCAYLFSLASSSITYTHIHISKPIIFLSAQ
jgi:hypothetical protein